MFRVFSALIALFFAAAATSASAQDFPALFSVTGVANSDVLNIRAEPSAQSPIVGHFAPHQTSIEVVGLSEVLGGTVEKVDEAAGGGGLTGEEITFQDDAKEMTLTKEKVVQLRALIKMAGASCLKTEKVGPKP